VYLKKFLMSMDIMLPHASAQPYRVPARRFGYILAGDQGALQGHQPEPGHAGEKVKALINEHLISLGINPKVPRWNCWPPTSWTSWLHMLEKI
jgi:type I restriction enzyme R subunit